MQSEEKVFPPQFVTKSAYKAEGDVRPFANYTVYPAVAALKYDEGSDVYAGKKGMFVLHANGEDMFDLVEPKVRKEY